MGAPELYVWRDHKLVGHFRGGHKSTTFSYEPDVTIPISLSLPIGRKPQKRAALNYLENLLPEGLGTRKAMAAATDADSTNTFDLLASVDSAGGLTFTKTPEEPNPTLAPAVVMTDTDIESQVARIATGAGAYSSVDGRTRFSLAGQQGKFTATRLTDRWFWPSATLPSTHIFKPDSNRFEHVAKVEHACMELARKMGRNVPTSSVSTIDGVDTYVVSRFDREVLSDGSVRRIHAEDLCQSLGIKPEDKYEPKAVDVAKVMHDGEMSDEDITEWFSQMACSVLLGNCDAHAKNYSVFLDAKAPKPCPMYDIVSTMVWPRYNSKLAMSVNGKTDASTIGLADWRAEARACNLDPDIIEASVRDMAEELHDDLPQIEASLGSKLGNRLHEVITHTTRKLSKDIGVAIAPTKNTLPKDSPSDCGSPGR